MIRDKIGQEIKTGAFIVYPFEFGDILGLRIGKVLAVEARTESRWGKPVEVYRITVRGTEDGCRWGGTPTLTSKNGTLLYPNRIVVLDPATVPAAYRDLLDPVPLA